MIDHKRKGREISVEVYIKTGPMYCGKSKLLIDNMQKATYAEEVILAVLPAIAKRETRNLFSMIKKNARLRRYKNLVTSYISTASELETLFYSQHFDRLVIDEAQFLDSPKDKSDQKIHTEFSECLRKIKKTAVINKTDLVIDIGGLDMDFEGKPFSGAMPSFMAMAKNVQKLEAVCLKCKSKHGVMTQRLIPSIDLIKVGDIKEYGVCCLQCHTELGPNS